MADRGRQLGLFGGCQRWSGRRASYRPAGEPFEPGRYVVEAIDFALAKSYVHQHHYSGSMPASRLQVGLFQKESAFSSSRLVGVTVLSVPVQERSIPAWLDGLNPRLGIEIGRLVLADEVPANGESWFLGRTFRVMRKELPEVQGVISYCDPIERRNEAGDIIKRGHTGVIYQAFNGRFVGRSSARTMVLSRDGRCISERALSKVRLEEQGAGYAIRQLQEMGAPPPKPFESGKAYVDRALVEGSFQRQRHPGNLCFRWILNPKKFSSEAIGRASPATTGRGTQLEPSMIP